MASFVPQDPEFESRVRDSFASLTLMATVGARLLRVSPGEVEIDLLFRDDLTQHHGFLAGAVLGPEDLVLPKLHRDRLSASMRALGIALTPAQEEALRLASIRGEIRRADLIARCGISREAARRALAGLERAGAIRRAGSGRGTRYVPVSRAP